MGSDSSIKKDALIIHELSGRIRVHCAALHDPALDPAYLEAVIGSIKGVAHVRINIRGACLIVSYDGKTDTKEKILSFIEDLPEDVYQSESLREQSTDFTGVAFRSAAAFLTPYIPGGFRAPASWLLSLPTILEGIDILVSEGIKVEALDASAVGFSLLRKDFVTANSVVAMLTLGRYMEQLSEQKSTELLSRLLRPEAESVWVEKDGREVKTEPDRLVAGDLVICGTGELVPVDGIVIDGDALVNSSSITGESVPVHVKKDDEIFSGSVLEEGRVKIKAIQVGAETGMARISRFLKNSLRYKSKSQTSSEKLADRLVPITLLLGIGLYILTRDVNRAASALTVDYSCAIKLATPVAVRVSMYTAARAGVLLKGSAAIDSLEKVDTVVFDKTGTLTRGVLEVVDVVPLGNMESDELLALAASAEEHYTHPVANAVARAASGRGLVLPATGQVDFIVAHGVSAYVGNKRVLVGSRHFINDDEKIDCAPSDEIAESMRKKGETVLFVARGKTLEGVISLRDDLRDESKHTLAKLKKSGIKKIIVLTGDHRETAKAVAGKIDSIDEIYWELSPEDKAEIVKNLKDQGHFIAFVGDGVNDAPAMVTSDVAICMPSGAELAKESSEVILLKDDLSLLIAAREIACNSRQTIKRCFNATLGINTLILLFATAGLLRPFASALLHNTATLGILSYAALAGAKKPFVDGQ